MKKVIVIILLLIVAAIGAGIYYLDSIAKSAIERGATYATGETTRVGSVSIGLLSGRFELRGLKIANPAGYAAPTFFSLGQTSIALQPKSLLSDRVEIPEFTLQKVRVELERKPNSKDTNVGVILDHLKGLQPQAKTGGAQPAGQPSSGKKFIVNKILIKDVAAHAVFAPELGKKGEVTVKVPAIELRNVGSDRGGVALSELSQIVLKAVLDAVAKKGYGLPPELQQQIQSGLARIKGAEAEVKGKVEAAKEEAKQKAQEKVEEKKQEVIEDIKKKLIGQ